MSVEHKDAPDAQRHEPKGISLAASGEVYVANGSGSGTWDDILSTVNNKNLVPLTIRIPDISTADSVWVVNPILGDIYKIYVVLDGAITTANSVVTAKINGVAVTGISITITQAGSAAGSTFSGTATGAKTVAAGTPIEIITDGGSSTAIEATVTILMDVS